MRLKFYEFKRRAVLKKPKCIIDIIRFKRKTWCRKKLPYTFNNYWKKYFSQTKHIFVLVNTVKCMSGGEMLKRGFNLVSKKKNPDKTAGSVESVMFWRCITFVDVGTFVPVDGNINSQKDT